MKFANIIEEFCVIPQGISFGYDKGDALIDPLFVSEKIYHRAIMVFRLGDFRFDVRFSWTTSRPKKSSGVS